MPFDGYRQEIRRALIRQRLVEMARTRRHASAMAWIAGLSLEEEEYAKSIFQEVEYEAAGGNVSGGHVPVSKVWDVPELTLDPVVVQQVQQCFHSFAEAVAKLTDALGKACEAMAKLVDFMPPAKTTAVRRIKSAGTNGRFRGA